MKGKIDVGLFRRTRARAWLAPSALLQSLQRHGVLSRRSMLVFFLEDLARGCSTITGVEVLATEDRCRRWCCFTWKMPSPISRIEISKVPPPRSKTAMLLALGVVAEAVGESRRGGLVDDAQDVEAGNGTRLLRRLPLCVVEVGGDRDDGVRLPARPDVVTKPSRACATSTMDRELLRRAIPVRLTDVDPRVAVLGWHDLERAPRPGEALHLFGAVVLAADQPLARRRHGTFRGS